MFTDSILNDVAQKFQEPRQEPILQTEASQAKAMPTREIELIFPNLSEYGYIGKPNYELLLSFLYLYYHPFFFTH